MAQFNDVTRKLVIVLNDGASAAGGHRTKTRTYSGLSETASAGEVMKAGQALASLMAQPVMNVFVNDKNEVLYDESDDPDRA